MALQRGAADAARVEALSFFLHVDTEAFLFLLEDPVFLDTWSRHVALMERPALPPMFSFDVRSFPPATCVLTFRFEAAVIETLASFLIPTQFFYTPFQDKVPRVEALCILLRVFSFPVRWSDIDRRAPTPLFSREASTLSRIFNHLLQTLGPRVVSFLKGLDVPFLKENAPEYVEAIAEVCGVDGGTIGFIDGKHVATCRWDPSVINRKKRPSLNYLCFLLPTVCS